MIRLSALLVLAAGCVAAHKSPAPRAAAAVASENAAAADLATTLVRAAGAQRIAPAIFVHEAGPVSSQHVALAAAGCYHAGLAWQDDSPLEVSVSFDPGTQAAMPGIDRRLAAPGGTLDFCTDRPGGATLTVRATTPGALAFAVVFGSAKDKARAAHHAAEPHARSARR